MDKEEQQRLDTAVKALGASLEEDTIMGDSHTMERLEELRKTLGAFLKPEVLQPLLDLYKALDRGPEQFCWFIYHSSAGHECRYAQGHLEAFKKHRLDKVKSLLVECLQKIEDL